MFKFDPGILECSLDLLDQASLEQTARRLPVRVCRAVSSIVRTRPKPVSRDPLSAYIMLWIYVHIHIHKYRNRNVIVTSVLPDHGM